MTYAQSFRIDAIFAMTHAVTNSASQRWSWRKPPSGWHDRRRHALGHRLWRVITVTGRQVPAATKARHSFCTGKPKIRCYRERSGILIQALGSAARGIGGCIGTTLTDALFGKPKHSLEILSEQDITMPEGIYPAHVKRKRRTWKRPRWFTPLVREYWDVDVESGIPARQGRELVGLRRRCDLRLKHQCKQRRNRVHGRQMRSHGCPETGDRYASLGWLPVASKSRCSHILGRSIPYRAKLSVQSAEFQLRGDGLRVSTHRYAASAKCLPARDLDS